MNADISDLDSVALSAAQVPYASSNGGCVRIFYAIYTGSRRISDSTRPTSPSSSSQLPAICGTHRGSWPTHTPTAAGNTNEHGAHL